MEEETPTLRICRYAHRASTLCAQIRQFLRHGSTRSSNTGEELLAEAQLFEQEMRQSWNDDGEEDIEADPAADAFSHRVLCCRTFFYAFRLKVQLTLLELLNKVRVETHDIHSTALQEQLQLRVQTVQSTADQILACVPLIFATEASPGITSRLRPRLWTDGVRMVWPLRLVALWSGTRDDQKQIAKGTLEQIRDELGIRSNSGVFVPSIYAA